VRRRQPDVAAGSLVRAELAAGPCIEAWCVPAEVAVWREARTVADRRERLGDLMVTARRRHAAAYRDWLDGSGLDRSDPGAHIAWRRPYFRSEVAS